MLTLPRPFLLAQARARVLRTARKPCALLAARAGLNGPSWPFARCRYKPLGVFSRVTVEHGPAVAARQQRPRNPLGGPWERAFGAGRKGPLSGWKQIPI